MAEEKKRMRLKKAGQQAAFLKIGLYGDTGTGKTFTACLIAEYLAELSKKRVAFLDTERGTKYYGINVKERKIHPEAFDFDVEYTRSIMFSRDFLRDVDTDEYGVVVVDSATHIWDAAGELYTGKKTRLDTNPIHAWAIIKKPWRQLTDAGVNGAYHWILCGREGNKFTRDDSGDFKDEGPRMRAEREAGYEPDFLGRMFQERIGKAREFQIGMHVEKDRSGIFTSKTIIFPQDHEGVIAKIRTLIDAPYNYLNPKAAEKTQTTEEAIESDIAQIEREKEEKREHQRATYEGIKAAILRAITHPELKAAFELAKGKKGILEDDLYGELEALKEQKKSEINSELARAAGVN